MRSTKFLAICFSILTILNAANAQLVWNTACKFDGNDNSYITVPNTGVNVNNPMNIYLLRPVTVECWVYPFDASAPVTQTIIQKAAGNNPSGFALYLDHGKPSVKVNNVHVLSAASQIPSQQWSHVAMEYDNLTGNWYIYINGVLSSQIFYSFNKIPNQDSLYIGKGSAGPYRGYIDEVRMWISALTAQNIQRNFRTSLATLSGFKAGAPPNNLQDNGYYTDLILSLTFQDDNMAGAVFTSRDWSGCGFNAKGIGVHKVDLSLEPSNNLALNESFAGFDTTASLIGADNIYNSPTSQITLEAWYNYSSGNADQYLIKKGSDYALYVEPGFGPTMSLMARINNQIVASYTLPKTSEWRHAAFTYNSQTGGYKLYHNGEAVVSGNQLLGPITQTHDVFRIGYHLIGYEDEVRVSDYVKSAQEIKDYMFKSIDKSNHPNPGSKSLNYSLDGYAVDNLGYGGSRMLFHGNSKFSAPSTQTNIPVSPVNRSDNSDFYKSWLTSGYLDKNISTSNVGGLTYSTINVALQPGTTINEISVAVALNHNNCQDLKIYLMSPQLKFVKIYDGTTQLGTNNNIITIFDDNADSSLINNRYTSFLPGMKPANSINSMFNGKSADGNWQLVIVDAGNASDKGIFYFWGLQINGGAANMMMKPSDNHTEKINQPVEFNLGQNYPNPFNPSTHIDFSIPKSGNVQLTVFDITGKEVTALVNGDLEAGAHSVTFDASNIASGVYFYKLQTAGFTSVKRMLLVK